MIKNIKSFILAGLLTVGLTLASYAQSNTTAAINAPVTAVPTVSDVGSNLLSTLNLGNGISDIISSVKSSGILSATNYAIEPYYTYAPSLKSGDKHGGGILAVYNLNKYVGAGIGLDYLGRFSLFSGNATLRAPVNLGNTLQPYLPFNVHGLTNVTVVPFALLGVGTPLGGAASSAAIVSDVGAYVQYGNLWGGKFNSGFAWGQWNNVGDYSGVRYHIFAGWSKGF